MNKFYFNSEKISALSLKFSKVTGLLLILLIPFLSFGQTFTNAGSYTYTAPAGITSLNVRTWGAGGAGGGAVGNATSVGGGGGGGAYRLQAALLITSGATLNYTVGTGGSGTNGNGTNGGTTTFSTVSVNGGTGGARGNSSAGAGGAGGTGGTFNGGSGRNGFLDTYGGGGGSSAGTGTNGNTAATITGATAVAGGGAGGNGGASSIVFGIDVGESGYSGSIPGGGGGGADRGDIFDRNGGDGGDGQIIITYTCPTYAITSISGASPICNGANNTISVNSNAAGLPIGFYLVTYNTTNPIQTGLTATMTVTTAGTGSFTATGFTNSGSSTVRVTALRSGYSSENPGAYFCTTAINRTASFTVNAAFSSGSISASGQTVCYNTSTVFSSIGSSGSASGGNGTYTYQWQYSTDNTFASGVVTVASNTQTYTPPTQALTQTIYYRRQARDGTCNTTFTSSSNIWAITVRPQFTSGAIDNIGEIICYGGTPASTIGSTVNASGGNNVITYSWRSSADAYTTAIAGATGVTYLPPSGLITTTSYRRYARDGACSMTPTVSTNTWTVTVQAQFVTGTIDNTGETICYGGTPASTIGSTVNASGGNTVITYSWRSSADGYTATIPGATGAVYLPPSGLITTTSYRRYARDGVCNMTPTASTNTWAVTVRAQFVTGSIDDTGESICYGGTPVSTIGSNVNASGGNNVIAYSWRSSADGYTAAIPGATGAVYLPPSGLITTTSYRRYARDGVCNTTPTISANTWTVAVSSEIPSPVIGTITYPDCMVLTGSVALSGLPVSGILNQTGTIINSYAITGTTMTISGLAAGTYTFSAFNGTCPSAPTGNVIINSAVTKIWSAGAWSPSAPTSSDAAVVNGNYSASSNGDLNVCSLIINPSFTLTIEPGRFVIIQNNLTIETGAVLDVLHQGSLVMVNDLGIVTNNGTGAAKVHRFTTPFKKNDYVYWSTPVITSAISSAVFPGWRTNYAYEYNNAWVYATAMTPAKGYIVMVPDPTTAPGGNVSEAVFKGKVNNGLYKIGSIAPSKSYLLGNPYPSALDADQFILQNSGVIGGTLYFWTHNTAIQLASNITNGTAGSGTYAYTSDDYASYNITGGTLAGSGGVIPSGKIASTQGFFTTSKASITGANEFVFNNSMRISSGVTSNSQFFKTKASKNNNKTAAIEKHRVWLNLSNTQGAFKQTLLGYISGATNSDDPLFDGKTLDGNKFVDFYSVNQSKNLVIQGRALPFDDKDEVPLGYKTAVEGTFTINIEQTDGLLTNQAIFLEDKLTKTVFNLKLGNYSFTTAKGTFNDRFVLRYSDKTLGIDDFETQAIKVLVSVKSKQIKINSFAETMDKVLIYDVSGKQLYKNDHVDNNELSVTNLTSVDQVLIVKTTLQNGTISIDKIVY